MGCKRNRMTCEIVHSSPKKYAFGGKVGGGGCPVHRLSGSHDWVLLIKLSLYATFYAPILAVFESCGVQFTLIQGLPCAPSNLISQINLIIVQRSAESSRLLWFRYIPVAWYDSLDAFTHKKDSDFHRDWNTEIFCACSIQAEISR